MEDMMLMKMLVILLQLVITLASYGTVGDYMQCPAVQSTTRTPECLHFSSKTQGNNHISQGFGKRIPKPTGTGNECSHNLSHWLWHETEHFRTWAMNSTFVTGVRDGTLHPTSFGIFMLQDAIFCLEMSKSFQVAANQLSDGSLKSLLEHEVKSYKRCGDELLTQWHIRNAPAIVVGAECQEYIDNHVNATRDEHPIYGIVAAIPCLRLWPWIGQQINLQNHQYGVYTDWVNYNFDPTYDGYKKLEVMTNEFYAKGLIDKDKALHYYAKSIEGEAAFFDSVKP